jgi:cell division protein FtsZ
MAARVIAEVVDPGANIIFGAVTDPGIGNGVQITVIATGFPARAAYLEDPRETRSKITDIGLQGVTSAEDAELPAFLRRNVRSLNVIGGSGEWSARTTAERR